MFKISFGGRCYGCSVGGCAVGVGSAVAVDAVDGEAEGVSGRTGTDVAGADGTAEGCPSEGGGTSEGGGVEGGAVGELLTGGGASGTVGVAGASDVDSLSGSRTAAARPQTTAVPAAARSSLRRVAPRRIAS
jgi:hypothetical protein